MFFDAIGWLGAILLAVSGLPQAIKSLREGNSSGISHGLIWLWLLGEVAMLAYTIVSYADPILLINYAANLIFVAVIAFYRYFPKQTASSSNG